ncbi:MAG: choice-of-anchor S family protein [Candidatus Heimdallarchaeota archaeon]
MKKIIKIGLPFLLVIVMLAPTMTKSAYNVAVGNSFTFDVVKSSWGITQGTNSSTGKGFEFEDVKYPEKTQFTIEVTAASASQVDWDWTVGTEVVAGHNDASDMFGLALFLFYPLFSTSSGTWNQTEADMGLPVLLPVFFVDPVALSDLYLEMSNDTYISTAFTDSEFIITNIGGTFDNTSTIAVFEWHLDMTLTVATDNINYGGTFTYIFAFDKTTGAVQGYYLSMDYSGTIDSIAVSNKFEQRVEQVGYNLPGVGFIPGFEWFLVIPAFALLVGLPIIIKRRK